MINVLPLMEKKLSAKFLSMGGVLIISLSGLEIRAYQIQLRLPLIQTCPGYETGGGFIYITMMMISTPVVTLRVYVSE